MFAWTSPTEMLHMGIMKKKYTEERIQKRWKNLYSKKFLHECQFSEFLYKHVQYLRTDSERW